MIYYSKYSEQQVFSDARLNVFLNQVYTFLINRVDEATIINNLILDGKIARLLLGQTLDDAVLKIEFSIQKKSIFDALSVAIASLDISSFTINEDVIVLQNNDVFFEFTLLDYDLKRFDYHGIMINDLRKTK